MLTESIEAELEATVTKKHYHVHQLETLLKDEQALLRMKACEHKEISFKAGVFICAACGWSSWV